MFENILAPLDGSPMADRILPHVTATEQINGLPIAQRSPQAITVLRVLEADGVELMPRSSSTITFCRRSMAHSVRKMHYP